MALPSFYSSAINRETVQHVLNEETSRHVVQVLRMQAGEQLQLTDGKGNLFTVELTEAHKKKAAVKVLSSSYTPPPANKISIAISLLKNASRLEWFLEKATEIGVDEIFPLVCHRTEKQHFRFERMNGILVSAMLQSQRSWLPVLYEPVQFDEFVRREFGNSRKFIAHCLSSAGRKMLHHETSNSTHQLILIGPEGDFTHTEIEEALQHHFIAVALGETRLRTETAGIVAATLLCSL